jgi:hypothetical protein
LYDLTMVLVTFYSRLPWMFLCTFRLGLYCTYMPPRASVSEGRKTPSGWMGSFDVCIHKFSWLGTTCNPDGFCISCGSRVMTIGSDDDDRNIVTAYNQMKNILLRVKLSTTVPFIYASCFSFSYVNWLTRNFDNDSTGLSGTRLWLCVFTCHQWALAGRLLVSRVRGMRMYLALAHILALTRCRCQCGARSYDSTHK